MNEIPLNENWCTCGKKGAEMLNCETCYPKALLPNNTGGWQICPKCNGNGNHPSMLPCPICNNKMIINIISGKPPL